MADYPTFPDAEAAVSQLLRDAGISGLDDRIYSSVPARPTYPLATVQRSGGVPAVRQALDAPRIDIMVWGENKGQAHDLVQECRAAVFEAEGTRVVTDVETVWVSGVEDALGVTYLQDPETDRDRYLISLRLYTRRLEEASS